YVRSTQMSNLVGTLFTGVPGARCAWPRLALADGPEDRLDVEDRRPVYRLEAAHLYSHPVDREDLDAMQPDRVGPGRRAGAEHAELAGRRVIARLCAHDAAVRAIQPGQQQDLVTLSKVSQRRLHGGLEVDPRVRRALVALAWSVPEVGQRR